MTILHHMNEQLKDFFHTGTQELVRKNILTKIFPQEKDYGAIIEIITLLQINDILLVKKMTGSIGR